MNIPNRNQNDHFQLSMALNVLHGDSFEMITLSQVYDFFKTSRKFEIAQMFYVEMSKKSAV